MTIQGFTEPVKKVVKAESRKKVDTIPWELRWGPVSWDLDAPSGFKCLHEKDTLINLMGLCNHARTALHHCPNGDLGCTHRHDQHRAIAEALDPSRPKLRPTPMGWGHTYVELMAKARGYESVVQLLESRLEGARSPRVQRRSHPAAGLDR